MPERALAAQELLICVGEGRDAPAVIGFWQSLTARVSALPGVVSASVANGLVQENGATDVGCTVTNALSFCRNDSLPSLRERPMHKFRTRA